MRIARFGVFAALASTALTYGCSTDNGTSVMAFADATVAAAPAAASAPLTVDNFMLADHKFMGHELYRMSDAKAIVLVTYGVGCPISRAMTPELKRLRDEYKAKGVEVLLLNSNLQDSHQAVAEETKEFGIDIPVLMDTNQLVGESLGVTRTAEVFVINPKTWQVVYRGPIDDRVDYGGAQKANAQRFAANALDALIAGRPAPQATAQLRGCLIDFPERAKKAQHTKISYAKDVAPIIESKCVSCHMPGSIGPMSFTSYEQVKGFSPMIREVIRTKRMPPWNVDPHVSKFQDDKSLTATEIKTLVHWIEAGAPRGSGPDPLAAKKRVAQEWPLGKPDLILDIPAYTIPASGIVDYQRPFMVNPLTEGKWIKASTYKVGDRRAVHHFLSGYMKDAPKPGAAANESRWGASVGGYAVGAESTLWPKNVGTYLPPGGAIGIQAHYTPYGKETTDKSQLALYFYKDNEKPGLVMRNSVIADNAIEIPAGAARHQETAYIEVPKDMLLYSAFPHAHYRGYASDLWVQTPDGAKKLLLAMPRYDFNWQREYPFAEPIKIPAGSKLIANYWYDNSKQNPANPDPTQKVVWGDQSFEEMFYTAIRYRWVDETATKLTNYDDLMQQSRMFGMMDDNIDGKIQKAELRGQMGQMIEKFWAQIDKDSDAALTKVELAAAQSLMGNRRRSTEQAASGSTSGGR